MVRRQRLRYDGSARQLRQFTQPSAAHISLERDIDIICRSRAVIRENKMDGNRPGKSVHIRIDAKRQALDALDDVRRAESNGNGKPANDNEIETIVEVADDLTSQSRHSLVLRGSPPAGKLLIPLERRDVRVVEGARLESVCRRNSTKGSNPFLSATPSVSPESGGAKGLRDQLAPRGAHSANPFRSASLRSPAVQREPRLSSQITR